MLSWIAASTTRIGITTKVLAVPFRPPALTAKMAETLDRLSTDGSFSGSVAATQTTKSTPSDSRRERQPRR
jgi:hypothetical protein